MDIASIIENTKTEFKRDRKSYIKEYLENNPGAVVYSDIKKARGASTKFYYMKNNKMVYNDYCEKNAEVLKQAFIKNNVILLSVKDIKH